MERGPFCHVCFQSRWVSRRASGHVGDISSHHHIDSAISFVIGLASMSPVYGSNQQSGTKPTINSTGTNYSSIQLVRDVSAQIDRGSCCSLETEVQTELPSRDLLPETMPSLRLLSLMHHQKSKNEFRWVPWKFRLSQAKSEEITAGKTTRLAKAEGIHLHSLLLDSPPELQVENGSMGMHALRQTFETFSYVMAMLELAHLATMKQYYMRFINLMTTRMDAETGLRNPTILEAQSADKTLMNIACELVVEQKWCFDDAIHEITFIRAEINTLLQPRPKLPKQTFQRLESNNAKGSNKGLRPGPYTKGKGNKGSGKQSGKSQGKVSWVTEITANGTKKQLCMRFQSGKCDLGSACRFHHGCAYPLPSGEACGKNHGALMHERTPH